MAIKKYFPHFTGGTTQTQGDEGPELQGGLATHLHWITADPKHLTLLNTWSKINCWRSPDQSAVEAGTEVQTIPDHDAVLCPCKYSSCSNDVHGECPALPVPHRPKAYGSSRGWPDRDPALCNGQTLAPCLQKPVRLFAVLNSCYDIARKVSSLLWAPGGKFLC